MSAQPPTTEAKPALTGATRSLISKIRRDRAWIIMMILPMLYFALFRYLPLYGMVIAFRTTRSAAASGAASGWG